MGFTSMPPRVPSGASRRCFICSSTLISCDMPDAAYFALIEGGSDAKPALGRPGLKDGGMTAFGGQLSKDDIWSIITWLRAKQAHEQDEGEVK